MAIGLLQSSGSFIDGFTRPVVPDRNYKRTRKPNIRVTKFGDGYEQRKPIGINNIQETYTLSFVNRPDTEIDDLNSFFEELNSTDTLIFRDEDSNGPSPTQDIVVVCESWDVTTPNSGVRSLTATFRRVYEA